MCASLRAKADVLRTPWSRLYSGFFYRFCSGLILCRIKSFIDFQNYTVIEAHFVTKHGGLEGNFVDIDLQAQGGIGFARAALAELLDVAESALKGALMLRFVAQFVFQVVMEQFDASLIGFSLRFGDGKGRVGVDHGIGSETYHAVAIDQGLKETRCAGAFGIVFGKPNVPDGVVLFWRFAGEKFGGIGAEAVFG